MKPGHRILSIIIAVTALVGLMASPGAAIAPTDVWVSTTDIAPGGVAIFDADAGGNDERIYACDQEVDGYYARAIMRVAGYPEFPQREVIDTGEANGSCPWRGGDYSPEGFLVAVEVCLIPKWLGPAAFCNYGVGES